MSGDAVLAMPGLPALMTQALAASGLAVRGLNEGALEEIGALVVSGGVKLDPAFVDSLPKLKLIAVHGVGYDGVDVAHAKARGVAVSNTPDVLTEDVADLGLALVLATLRGVPDAERFLRAGEWAKGGRSPLTRRVTGLRYGVLGLGRIGRAIAARLAPFAGEVAYHSRRPVPGVDYRYAPDARTLAASVDVLVVATPGGPETRGLVNAEVLEALGPDGVLINIARGEVVDQPALIAALDAGRLYAAGLDVFDGEPVVPQALLDHPRCVLTPHVGSATVEARTQMADLVVANLKAGLAGEPLLTPVG
ncbi:2-hydroxyacid dehydrogenase [Brevundimonas sp. GCM10030266]|uniref:2-hydroxyacid dehydrogenase n=1 Tax=Brevundimonas sp. GCM10030266 TaxID=3273386 RepID=UPI003615E283